ncbi:homeobox protein rough-like [Ylistrum balloti]|uniref:homeobox protein rough-like n=1 Tax=Ylistrum balloti TaxID=509963 RepID=UPI002905A6F8|nr:homeobox protein rough-like [Ylistrum balloti]
MFSIPTSLKSNFPESKDDSGTKNSKSETLKTMTPKLQIDTLNVDNIPQATHIGGPFSAFSSWKPGNIGVDGARHLLHSTGLDKISAVEYPKQWLGEHSPVSYSLGTQGLPMTPVFAGIMQRRKRRENRPRRQRTTFTSEQTLKLELEYNRTEYISRPRRYELAEVLNLSENQIKIWFQNRRAKEKRIEKAHQDQQIRSNNMTNIGMPAFPTSGPYSMFCGPCVWPYPPGTLTNVLASPTKPT